MNSGLQAEIIEYLRWIESTCEGKRGQKPCCEACTVKKIHAKTRMFLTRLDDQS